ncbi:hypothetical protein A2U01_0058388, partial [Trifolium medium]|nr:hypothetical protein [Trifolium medium]
FRRRFKLKVVHLNRRWPESEAGWVKAGSQTTEVQTVRLVYLHHDNTIFHRSHII